MSIVARAKGGLGNRMRFIAAYFALNQRLSMEIKVLWMNNYELNCIYDSLFLSLEGIMVTDMTYFSKLNKIGLFFKSKQY